MDWLCRSRGRRAAAKVKTGRSGGAIVEFDNLAGGWLSSGRGRRPVEVRVLIWSKGNRKREMREI